MFEHFATTPPLVTPYEPVDCDVSARCSSTVSQRAVVCSLLAPWECTAAAFSPLLLPSPPQNFLSMLSLVDIMSGLWLYAHNGSNTTVGGWWNDMDM